MACGVLLVGWVATRYVSGWYASERARQQWQAMRAHAIAVSARSAADVATSERSVIGAPVARLLIPRIGLDEIVIEGVGDDELNAGPGHLPGSALPGAAGNAVVSAHRDRHFDRLGELAVGDTVETESLAGRERWVVVRRRVIDRNAPALFRTASATLTLTTCWPIRYFGPAPQRLILTARLLGEPRTALVSTSSHRG